MPCLALPCLAQLDNGGLRFLHCMVTAPIHHAMTSSPTTTKPPLTMTSPPTISERFFFSKVGEQLGDVRRLAAPQARRDGLQASLLVDCQSAGRGRRTRNGGRQGISMYSVLYALHAQCDVIVCARAVSWLDLTASYWVAEKKPTIRLN